MSQAQKTLLIIAVIVIIIIVITITILSIYIAYLLRKRIRLKEKIRILYSKRFIILCLKVSSLYVFIYILYGIILVFLINCWGLYD